MTSSRVYTITSRLGGVRELLLPGGARLLSVAVHTGQVGADAVVDTVDVGAWGQEWRRFSDERFRAKYQRAKCC